MLVILILYTASLDKNGICSSKHQKFEIVTFPTVG